MAPLVIPLRYSSSLSTSVMLVHLLPLTGTFGQGVGWPVRLAVFIAVVFSAVYHWMQRRRLASATLVISADGRGELRDGESSSDVELLSSSTTLGPFAILIWREVMTGRVARRALARDGLTPEQWRRLRIRLRWPQAA